jgi:hypothetical protein
MIKLIVSIVQDKGDTASVNVVTVESGTVTGIERLAAENIREVIETEVEEELVDEEVEDDTDT